VAPVVEEIFFRGYVFRAIAVRKDVRVAYLVSAMAFAAFHQLPTLMPVLFVVGLLFSLIYQRTDIALIHHDEFGLSFEALEESYASQPQEEIQHAFNDLSAEMLRIVARLLGRETAHSAWRAERQGERARSCGVRCHGRYTWMAARCDSMVCG
jgi:hypothetical protein